MDSPAAKPVEPDPGWKPAFGERRRHVRQKVHAPAYASLNTNSSGMVLDLNEVLDISEQGMAIQTASPPELNSSLNLSLDLSETKSFLHTTGEVIWSDRSGRTGIRFPNMPYASVRQLKEWLFLNAITACSNHLTAQGSHLRTEGMRPEPVSIPQENPAAPSSPDYTAMLGALGAVQREVESLGADLDRALQLIAERAQDFTRASGAAIALQHASEMICQASSGDAPPIGARLQIGSGFSGECVRLERLLRCDDSETDPRVDRESCRALGIRSMIAIPIRANGGVVGLLEVFSPKAHAFTDNDNIVVRRLAETASISVRRADSSGGGAASDLFASETETETETEAPIPDSSRFRRGLMIVVAAAVVGLLVWLLLPKFSTRASAPSPPVAVKPQAVARPAGSISETSDLEGMRRLAEQGDPAAQFAVGAHYVTGEGVVQDYPEAVRWFSMAAQQGHVTAQSTLGAYYGIGRGVSQDFPKAYFWSILAQAGGDEASKYRIPLLVSHLTRAQIVVIQQQANDWLKQHQLASSKPSPAR
jgi:TPR repeat protein/putative methionine-R-sulfoxide reductase with GAF domain